MAVGLWFGGKSNAGQQPAAPDWRKYGPRRVCSFGHVFSFSSLRCFRRQPVSRELAGRAAHGDDKERKTQASEEHFRSTGRLV